jgi:hypothetical protein
MNKSFAEKEAVRIARYVLSQDMGAVPRSYWGEQLTAMLSLIPVEFVAASPEPKRVEGVLL